MNKIKTSSKGIAYASPKVLCVKQSVVTKAILNKIPHNDPLKIHITLKIGRYKINTDTPDVDDPKSELTLANEELDNLISYIEEYYKPMVMGEKNFISIGDNNDSRILKNFSEFLKNKSEIAQLLIDEDILTDNIYLAASIIKKKNAIKEFEAMLPRDLLERKWQDWFTNNKWILGSDFACIIDERDIDLGHTADYVMKAFDGFVDLVEIKKPNGLSFWATAQDHNNYYASSHLTKAIAQCLNYIYEIERESNSVKSHERFNAKIIKPRCTLIFGRSNDWNEEQKEAFRILNSAYTQINIFTYDQLLDRAKNILGLEVSEDDSNNLF